MNSKTSYVLGFALVCLVVAPALRAMSVLAPTFNELVAEAGQVVHGRVVAVEPFRTAARDGRPVIKTRVTWQVDETLKGENAAQLTLTFFGGRIGTAAVEVAGMPRFAVGEEDFLFVEPNHDVICPLIGAAYGRYRVRATADGGQRYLAHHDGRPLTDVREIGVASTAARTAAGVALTPEQFAASIRAAVQNPSAPRHE